MKISGFTFIKNGDKLYIPLKEAILSILPICDEFVIALGDNDADDETAAIIASIGSDKIKIINTVWDTKNYPKNTEFARQTDIAKDSCTGDWLFYIQCDEAVHQQDLPAIKKACETYLNDFNIDGFLFKYYHFWGDYKHYHKSHAWYQKEIRIVRNDPKIHSWKDAQSFRKFDTFKGRYEDYQNLDGGEKLKVKLLDAYIYHYGFVRPPILLTKKIKEASDSYRGKEATLERYKDLPNLFDYGPLDKVQTFTGTHPEVMAEWMAKIDWEEILQHTGKAKPGRPLHKHEKLKYRVTSWLENTFRNGKTIGGWKNYRIIK
jgi:hypothetical protein